MCSCLMGVSIIICVGLVVYIWIFVFIKIIVVIMYLEMSDINFPVCKVLYMLISFYLGLEKHRRSDLECSRKYYVHTTKFNYFQSHRSVTKGCGPLLSGA